MEYFMRIASWNVNGIRAVATKGFAESLEAINADIIGIQEIKALREQLGPEITDIPGYKSWFYSAEKKGYSGTALYSKIDPVSIDFGFGVEEFDHEGRVIKADFGEGAPYDGFYANGLLKALPVEERYIGIQRESRFAKLRLIFFYCRQ